MWGPLGQHRSQASPNQAMQPCETSSVKLSVQRPEAKRAFPGLCSFLNVVFHIDLFNSFKWFNPVSIFKTSLLIWLHQGPRGNPPHQLKTRLKPQESGKINQITSFIYCVILIKSVVPGSYLKRLYV